MWQFASVYFVYSVDSKPTLMRKRALVKSVESQGHASLASDPGIPVAASSRFWIVSRPPRARDPEIPRIFIYCGMAIPLPTARLRYPSEAQGTIGKNKDVQPMMANLNF